MIIVLFHMDDNNKSLASLKKTFLLADISMIVAFQMLFLILNNDKFNFNNRKLK